MGRASGIRRGKAELGGWNNVGGDGGLPGESQDCDCGPHQPSRWFAAWLVELRGPSGKGGPRGNTGPHWAGCQVPTGRSIAQASSLGRLVLTGLPMLGFGKVVGGGAVSFSPATKAASPPRSPLELLVFKLILAFAFNEQLGSDQAGFLWLTNL